MRAAHRIINAAPSRVSRVRLKKVSNTLCVVQQSGLFVGRCVSCGYRVKQIIVFVLEDQLVRFFLAAAAAALVYYPFSFGRKVHVGEPAAADFLLSKRANFVFWSTHREKKRCVCCCKSLPLFKVGTKKKTHQNKHPLFAWRKKGEHVIIGRRRDHSKFWSVYMTTKD